MTQDLLTIARRYVAAGLSVIPVRADGSKASSVKWEEFKERLPTDEELVNWFDQGRPVGIAIVCGRISGNLAVLDFESDAAWQMWVKQSEQTMILEAIQDCPVIKTPKGGRHVYYRISETWVAGTKLARRSTKETIIESRGQGHYVLAVGSPPACHELNIPYVFENEGWLKSLTGAMLAKEVWDASCVLASEQNEWVDKKQVRANPAESNAKGDRPGDEFNRRALWSNILESHGWSVNRTDGSTTFWTRPGKKRSIGCSATTGKCRTEGSGDLFYCFSTNALPFESDTAYSKFSAYTLLNHGGDYNAAAKDLVKQGYSCGDPATAFIGDAYKASEGATDQIPDDGIPADPDFATNKDFEKFDLSVKWVWEKWLQVGTVNLLAAEGGLGKTRFMGDLCRRAALGLSWPDGSPSEKWKGDYLAMWVAGDRNHAELVDLSRKFGFYDRISYSGSKLDPFGGITLNSVGDFMTLYKRVKAARPLFLVIDTAGGSTSFNMAKQEEARSFFAPLSDIAAKLSICVVVITHLNASKNVLGKRAEERVRCVIRMSAENKDPSTPRRLEIVKSNSLYPNPIGMMLGEAGNEYDTENVPDPPDQTGSYSTPTEKDSPERGPDTKVRRCQDWLELELSEKPRKVYELRREAETAGFDPKCMYKAKNAMGLMEFDAQGYKWWGLRKDGEA